jgi:hypothetical protein
MSTLNRYSSQRYAAFSNEVKTIPVRLSVIRVFAIATVATMALAGCANQSGTVPSSPSAMAPTTAQAPATAQNDASADDVSPHAPKTCATSPPQYEWIFKGLCQMLPLTSSGVHFSLSEWQGIRVKGSIGRNTAKGTVKIALADAIDKNGDIKTYKGKSFPKYVGHGTTYLYATAVNQGTQTIYMVTVKGEPVLQYTITNMKGFGDANICGAALLHHESGKFFWEATPESGLVIGKTVTLIQYVAPKGFEWVPKIPLYFAVYCYKQ